MNWLKTKRKRNSADERAACRTHLCFFLLRDSIVVIRTRTQEDPSLLIDFAHRKIHSAPSLLFDYAAFHSIYFKAADGTGLIEATAWMRCSFIAPRMLNRLVIRGLQYSKYIQFRNRHTRTSYKWDYFDHAVNFKRKSEIGRRELSEQANKKHANRRKMATFSTSKLLSSSLLPIAIDLVEERANGIKMATFATSKLLSSSDLAEEAHKWKKDGHLCNEQAPVIVVTFDRADEWRTWNYCTLSSGEFFRFTNSKVTYDVCLNLWGLVKGEVDEEDKPTKYWCSDSYVYLDHPFLLRLMIAWKGAKIGHDRKWYQSKYKIGLSIPSSCPELPESIVIRTRDVTTIHDLHHRIRFSSSRPAPFPELTFEEITQWFFPIANIPPKSACLVKVSVELPKDWPNLAAYLATFLIRLKFPIQFLMPAAVTPLLDANIQAEFSLNWLAEKARNSNFLSPMPSERAQSRERAKSIERTVKRVAAARAIAGSRAIVSEPMRLLVRNKLFRSLQWNHTNERDCDREEAAIEREKRKLGEKEKNSSEEDKYWACKKRKLEGRIVRVLERDKGGRARPSRRARSCKQEKSIKQTGKRAAMAQADVGSSAIVSEPMRLLMRHKLFRSLQWNRTNERGCDREKAATEREKRKLVKKEKNTDEEEEYWACKKRNGSLQKFLKLGVALRKATSKLEHLEEIERMKAIKSMKRSHLRIVTAPTASSSSSVTVVVIPPYFSYVSRDCCLVELSVPLSRLEFVETTVNRSYLTRCHFSVSPADVFGGPPPQQQGYQYVNNKYLDGLRAIFPIKYANIRTGQHRPRRIAELLMFSESKSGIFIKAGSSTHPPLRLRSRGYTERTHRKHNGWANGQAIREEVSVSLCSRESEFIQGERFSEYAT
ncbi:hypothetical protein IEQ34_021453 [Dendrobium chrysotoxum]|uniref:Uncharacterized protein n=1 Tax=Dendrobium chrysotoxum TaxID=161865 RepID=A0AAV7G345_DENCH|nr:hypothetical protein IEQ34_021453 [Dendrobium chrysotoxum]